MNQTQEPITTDVPLGLDEPNTVWDARCVWYFIPALSRYPVNSVPVFLTLEDAEHFKANFPPDVIESAPIEYPFDYVVLAVKKHGMNLLVLDSEGNEVCK